MRKKVSFFDEIQKQLNQKKPFALYRYPNKKCLKGIVQISSETHLTENFSDNGFVFSKFNNYKSYIIPEKDAIQHKFKYHSSAGNLVNFKEKIQSPKAYKKLVQHALNKIESTSLKKVVLTDFFEVNFEKESSLAIFKNLLNVYPSQFVYMWYHPKMGIWMGASPELLLNINKRKKKIKTVSLAGTLKDIGENPKWSGKELEEQSLVTEYIKTSLKNQLKDLQVRPLKNVRAGSLWHLKTKIKGIIIEPFDMSSVLNLLHPTPAVCGLPKDDAIRFINNYENYNREFYTGFVGYVKKLEKTKLYVNLRCMSIKQNEGRIYVGAGITSKSDPDKEWEEIRNKAQTILRILSI